MNSLTHHLFAIVALLALNACSSDKTQPMDSSTLNWSRCEQIPTLDCATLTVPIAYNDINGTTIKIALNRQPAQRQPAQGAILFNPGGPGASGIELLETLVQIDSIPNSVSNNHDLIGFDPRGIGGSTPVDCSDTGIDNLDEYIVDDAAIEQFVDEKSSIADSCFERHGDYIWWLLSGL